jgi:hypothetical protein
MYCVKSVGGTFNDIFLPPAFVLLQQVHNGLDWSSLMDLQDSFSVLCLLFLFSKPERTDKRTDVWSWPSCIYTQIFSPKKTGASKVAHNWPRPFYFTVHPRPQPTAQNCFSYYEISGPDICSLICARTLGGHDAKISESNAHIETIMVRKI